MPDQYIDVPIEFDENALYQQAIARIQLYFPDFNPAPGGLIDLALRGTASMAAVGAEVASDVPANIFRAFGQLAGKPPIDAAPATVDTVWTAKDAIGYTIPAQTPVGLTTAGSSDPPIGFWVLSDTDIPPGQTTIQITLTAVNSGAEGSGLDTIVRTDSLGYITNIALAPTNTASANGIDAELDDAFANRLSQEFETWTTTPIKGKDFATKSRDIGGVWRSGYIENYNPADGTTNNDKMVTLCPIDVNGADVSSAERTAVANLMESLREVNFICNVVTATRSIIDVSYTGHVSDLTVATQVEADIATALNAYLNQAIWGGSATQTGQIPVWNNNPYVRYSKVMTAIESVDNLDYADNVTIGIHGGAMGTADILMPGAFPLPNLGTITPTIVSP